MTKFSIPLYFFTGLAALAMASVAAFFSITGLAALYAAAAIPIIIMGTCIEFSKIVSTVWLHKFWKKSNYLMVGIMTLMVVSSMAVTSGGVYGFLTGSHASQEAPTLQKQMSVDHVTQQIQAEQDKINRNQERLKSLDTIVTTSLSQGTNSGKSADSINRRQASERSAIQSDIDASYKQIDSLSGNKLQLTQEQSEVEAKLGAVKYLAALFGADPSNAVMYFTLVMVLLLDPFAIMLVIATQIAYENRKKELMMSQLNELAQTIEPEDEFEIPTLPEHTEVAVTLDEALKNHGFEPVIGERIIQEESFDPEAELDLPDVFEEPNTSIRNDEKMTNFFNDEYVNDSISNAEDETIIRIDEVVNTKNMTDNEKIEQVINALASTLPPEDMDEVKKRWLD